MAYVINIQPYAISVNPYAISAEIAAAARIRSYLLRSGSRLALLANLYLHWFDALFYGPQGPGRRADAKLVRRGWWTCGSKERVFSLGYPASAYGEIERHVRDRLIRHLQRHSQRPSSERGTMAGALGALGADPSIGCCACLRREFPGEPDAGNLHLRFDEGRVGTRLLSYSTGSA